MKININKSANFSKIARFKKNIQFIVIHYTGMQSVRASISRLQNTKSKVSSHYLIDRNGEIYRIVNDNKVAWHAGKSKWKNYKNLNSYSIGIEIQNRGHSIKYQKFPSIQISSLVKLIKMLMKKYNIKSQNILGHSDIAPFRKKDPGEKFPWEFLSKKGISIWYNKIKFRNYNLVVKNKRKFFFRNIFKIGYRYFSLSKHSEKDKMIIRAFQRRFLPKEISGKLTPKTLIISHLLANKSNSP